LLSWVGLEDHINSRPSILSGGQKQRVAIARAIIARPQLLLADEPTGNVDDKIAERLMHLLGELNKIGTTIIVATHNRALVSAFPYPRLHLVDGELLSLPPISQTVADTEGGYPTVQGGSDEAVDNVP